MTFGVGTPCKITRGLAGIKLFMSLKEIVDVQHGLKVETEEGRSWCSKALNPADPLVDLDGVPDRSSVPSLLMNYQTQKTYSGDAAVDNWDLDFSLIPHPLLFGYSKVSYTDAVLNTPIEDKGNILNLQFGSAYYQNALTKFCGDVERWRIAYMSATFYLNATATTDQGTVVAAMVPVGFRTLYSSATVPNGPGYSTVAPGVMFFQYEDEPNGETLQMMPNMYFGKAKEGVYMPLKLTKGFDKWRDASSLMFVGNRLINNETAWVTSEDIVSTDHFPFPMVDSFALEATQLDLTFDGQLTPTPCSGSFGHVCFKGLDKAASVTVVIRCGFQVQVHPTSMLAPQMKISPEYDGSALSEYFRIARRLKDAYPANYNDLGKLWKTILSVIESTAPVLDVIVPGLGKGLKLGSQGIELIRRNVGKKKKKPTRINLEKASAIEKQEAAANIKKQLSINRRK